MKPYESISIGKRFCWPTLSEMKKQAKENKEKVEEKLTDEFDVDKSKLPGHSSSVDQEEKNHEKFGDIGPETIFGDLFEAWPIYIVSMVLSLIITLLFFYALEKCALFIIKVMMALFVACMFLLGLFFFLNFLQIKSDTDVQNEEAIPSLVGAIIVWGILALFLCLICCSWPRIKFAAAIIQATADYITDIKRIFFIPIFFFIATIGLLVLWGWGGIYLFSSGDLEHDPSVPYGRIKWNGFTK